MKKYLSLIFIFLLILTLSSCALKNNIKEIKIDGDKMSDNDIEKILEDYEEILEDDENESEYKKELFDGWYQINLDTIVNKINDDKTVNVKMNVSGKIYESNFTFEQKMQLKIVMECKVEEESKETTVKYNATIKYLDGICYLNAKTVTKTSGDYEKSTSKQEVKKLVNVDDVLEGVLSDIELDTEMSVSKSLGYSFMELLASDYLSDDAKFYQKNNTYYYNYEDENENDNGSFTTLRQMMFEFKKDSYEVKAAEIYSKMIYEYDDDEYEIIMKMEISTSIGAIISKPLNEKAYENGKFEIPDIL